MKILLTNNHLENVGGSETWTQTMAAEMMRRGFDTEILTLIPGAFSEQMDKKFKVNPSFFGKYDLILANHNSCLQQVLLRGFTGFKIFTSHGTVPTLEQPIPGADAYVAISEEIQLHLAQQGFQSTVIKNPVDCERFAPIEPIREKLSNVLLISDYPAAQQVIKEVCEKLGLFYDHIGKDKPCYDAENAINAADLVVSLGRGCYEAMACGRNVLVFDCRHYMSNFADGLITPENIEEFLKTNCSGRRMKFAWGVEGLSQEFLRYKIEYGEANRAFALENFDVKKVVDQYLKIAGL